jgi:adenosylcobinamide-GDP ribazoletransferase
MFRRDSSGISHWIAFLTAVQFLTRVPVSAALPKQPFDYRLALRKSVLYFPLVGLLVGCFTSVVFSSLTFFWSTTIAACLAIAAEAWVTGAFHEDAFADATDALGGGWTREKVLEILKDSRHGTFGVLALVLGIGLRVLLIAEIGPVAGLYAIPISAMIGRWSILWIMAWIPPIEDRHTMARDVGSQTSWRIFLASGTIAVAAWIVITAVYVMVYQLLTTEKSDDLRLLFTASVNEWWSWLAIQIVFLTLVISTMFGRYMLRRVGGITGDFLGANCFLVQLTILLLYAAHS